MMSQDHQQPGDGEEAGEDEEEGDMEARTAVAALLALTSPTDYAYTGYEDDYLIDSTPDDYMTKSLSPKCVADYGEDGEPMETLAADERVQMVQSSEMDMQASELQEERDLMAAYPSSEGHEVDDDGLAQLRAFVQVTEGKSDDDEEGKSDDDEEMPKVSVMVNSPDHKEEELIIPNDSMQVVRGSKAVMPSQGNSSRVNRVPELSPCTSGGSRLKKSSIVSNPMGKNDLKGSVSRGTFSETQIANQGVARHLTDRDSQETSFKENALARQNFGSSGLHKDLIKEKGVSTLESSSDSDSDSGSDDDSDSGSSDSSSSDSDDDGSDSESDSETDTPKEEQIEKVCSPANIAQVKSSIPSMPLKVASPTEETVAGDRKEIKTNELNIFKPKGEEKLDRRVVSKTPPMLKVPNLKRPVMRSQYGQKTLNEKKGESVCVMDRSPKLPVKSDIEKTGLKSGVKAESILDSNSKQVSFDKGKDKTEVVLNTSTIKPVNPVMEKSKIVSSVEVGRGIVSKKEKKEPNTYEKESDTKKDGLVKSVGQSKAYSQNGQNVTNVACSKENILIPKHRNMREDKACNRRGDKTDDVREDKASNMKADKTGNMREDEACLRGDKASNKRGDKTDNIREDKTGNMREDKTCMKTGSMRGDKTGNIREDKTGNMREDKACMKTGSIRGDKTDNTREDKTANMREDKACMKTGSVRGDKTGNKGNRTGNTKEEKVSVVKEEKTSKIEENTSTVSVKESKTGKKEESAKCTDVRLKELKKNKRVAKVTKTFQVMSGVDTAEEVQGASSPQRLSLPQQQKKPPVSQCPKEVPHQKDKDDDVKFNHGERLSRRNNSSDSRNSQNSDKSDKVIRRDTVCDKGDNNCDKDADDKFESEVDDMFPMPIQAEVIMSEGSESGIEYGDDDKMCPDNESVHWFRRSGDLLQQSDKENSELVAYLQSFVNGGGEGEVIEYPPPNNELPAEGTDLTQWQLDGVHLPPFTPNVAPPSWLRLTIPAEGYRCHSCSDTFFIESSLVQHRERRSVWINLECGPCDAKLTFYNRCALKDHLRMHLLHGEEVDEETVDVRSLPLQLTRLLQPILVPVPQSLQVANMRCLSKSHGSVTKLPTLKPVGKGTAKLLSEKLSEENFADEDDSFDEDMLSTPEKIPVGMKRLSPRRRTVRCYLCERMFHSVRELMAHMRTDQPYSDQRVECRKCQLVLPSVCAAKAHILTHPPANTSNVSVCPECGNRCDGPRDFVHHLNTCGHQFRRSGMVCTVCQVCFFKSQDDFLTHWILEHCEKSYECVVCQNTFESLVFHNCQSPGQQVLATFRCLLTCPLCSQSVQLHAQEESDANVKIQAHLADCHPSIITRVHYVYKSKFCTNAFRSKDELRAHHDREHRRDNHYRTKTCTLLHEVLGYQHQYFNGQEPRNAFVTLPVALSAEELHEARIRDVPTVSSVIDKTLFPDVPSLDNAKVGKAEKHSKAKGTGKGSNKEVELQGLSLMDSPIKKDIDQLDKLRPNVCYRCGYMYADGKDFRRHKRSCDGEANERQCQVCGLTAIGEEFARHCRGHIQDSVVLCIYCNGMQFSNTVDLEQHFELHVHEQFLYPAICAFCSTSLPDVPSALAHLNEEHDPFHVQYDTSEFECNRCGRHFHGERGLSVHLGRCTLGTATPTPSSTGCRQCQVCTKALTPEMFGRHMVCHLEEGLLVCSLCDGRTLPSSMALLHHLEEHAAALAYPSLCPMCNFTMLDSTSALTHLKEEHGFGNLLCAECDMHYNFTYQLQRHTDIVHKLCLYAKRRYICWICRAYDHVKKETLMNHFRTVHGLDREQVDEKAMIRTRGQGTMPTSQFIPTKPLGSKEIPGLSSPSKGDVESTVSKPQKEKSKTSPLKGLGISELSSDQQSQGKSLNPSSPVKGTSIVSSSSLSNKIITKKKEDLKLKDKTKVLIKRLPDSILDDHSRCKRRKVDLDDKRPMKKLKKRKKLKAYKCSTCGFGTNNQEKHYNHILKHEEALKEVEPDGYVCSECGASFVVEPSLARHMFFAHKVKLPVASVDESETDMTAIEQDVSVSAATKTSSEEISPTVKVSKTSKEKLVAAKNLSKEKVNNTSGKEKLNTLIKDEEMESVVKQHGETQKKKGAKNEVKQIDTVKIGNEAKRRKVAPVVEEIKIKEEKDIPIIKEEVDEMVTKTIKEEKKVSRSVFEVKDTIAKRKAARITAQKKQRSELMKVEKDMTKSKVEKDNVKKKVVKELNKKMSVDVSVKKSILKGTTTAKSKLVKESTIRKKSKEVKKKLKVVTKRRLDKDLEMAKSGEERGEVIFDDRCVVCKEKFTNPVELYSHLRTHGMAFLKLGRKARPLGMEKPIDR